MLRLTPGAAGAPLHVLCLGAHCDDIEIGCGGALLRLLEERSGSSVRWAVFSGEAPRAGEARASACDFLAAAAFAQVSVEDYRENYFPYSGDAIKDALFRLREEFTPDVVFTHRLEDRHQDHRTVAELTWNTFRDHLILEYEIPKYEGDLGAPNVFVPLAEAVARRKVELILRHYGSQRHRPWFRGETFEALLRLRGVECNAEAGWAEAFHCRKTVL